MSNPLDGVMASAADIVLKADPINPAWVLSGTPEARCGEHSRNVDGWASTMVWECTPGRFRWHFGWEETVMVLEGSVRVTNAAGQTHTLSAGDIGYFPAGTWWVWEIDTYLKKIAFCRGQLPRTARLHAGLLTTLRAKLRPARMPT